MVLKPLQILSLKKHLTSKSVEGGGETLTFPHKPAKALFEILETYLEVAEVRAVYEAYHFAVKAHAPQKRSSGEPYIHHPLAVASILTEIHMDYRTLMAAILHDVIEDTGCTRNQLAVRFGKDVAEMVEGVSKIGKISFRNAEQAEAENFRKMLLAMSKDLRVIFIKLADRLHNMRTLGALRTEKRWRIAHQTLDIYAPLANRLGMYQWCRELEDLSFSHMYPMRYKLLEEGLRRRRGHGKNVDKKLSAVLEKRLRQEGIQADIQARQKNIYGIYRKLREKHLTLRSLNQLTDVFGLRIIVNTVTRCYQVLGIVHNLCKPVPGRFKDYIAIPKANGYQSLHTVVYGMFGERVEVQIRTEQMHRVAETGIAAHWLYKSRSRQDEAPQRMAREWLLDLLSDQQHNPNPGEFLEHLKTDLFPDQIYVFTPKGAIKKFPKKATALDFAYAVHSDIGNRCTGAIVNDKRVPLRYGLHNGDRVEILTSATATPSPSWLDNLVTGKARSAVRNYLKTQRNKDAIKMGDKLLKRALQTIFKKKIRITEEQKSALLILLSIDSWNRLLTEIGLGERMAIVIARQLLTGVAADDVGGSANAHSLAIEGTEGMLVQYAKCCNPIPGDRITGVFTSEKGLVIHADECKNIQHMLNDSDHVIPVHWATDIDGQFQTRLRLDTINKPGVLALIAADIAAQHSNIISVEVRERDGLSSVIAFTIEVANRIHLARILRSLRGHESIMHIARLRN
ncbi:MAG TPA: bifunctional (p)ppGpp synthetase/guanosine-3',5'-bis(diphosphate) 3'-pyrophosphohydrolase [Gammaproteobacteria bacterium]|nr:bifunctional (p)ppGpp synthetase/guanosine-3',5'-bis(diphosphate) 3'-pyrophosphohydrolase [Gammaproteobacteria bacterium]